MDISKKIIADPINKWVFNNSGTEVYLVGGYIRDFLIGRKAYDKDYVLKKNAKQIAQRFAKKFNGTFIKLKEEITYRVALKNGEFIDFNNFKGKIEGDLLLRDYTVNAMAWSPETGIIDPTGGMVSLRNKNISAIAPNNLQKDPLRVLRGYRIAAELHFSIDACTRAYLKQYSDSLIKSAPERITGEIYKLLNSTDPLKYLRFCAQDGIFRVVFNVTNRNIKVNLELLAVFDDFMENHEQSFGLKEHISQNLSRLGLIRLSLLIKDGTNPENNSSFLKYISPSNIIYQKIHEIQNALIQYKGRITDSKLYKIYKTAGTSAHEIALIMASTRSKKSEGQRFINKANDYHRITERHLIDGNEIQRLLCIEEGALIGTIQEKIRENQFRGFLKSKSETREWIISNFT